MITHEQPENRMHPAANRWRKRNNKYSTYNNTFYNKTVTLTVFD